MTKQDEQLRDFRKAVEPIIVKVFSMGQYSEGKSTVRHDTLLWAREQLETLFTKTCQHYEMKERAVLSLLVAEIQGCRNIKQVKEILAPWIKANNLHPEKVKTFGSREELNAYLQKEGGKPI